MTGHSSNVLGYDALRRFITGQNQVTSPMQTASFAYTSSGEQVQQSVTSGTTSQSSGGFMGDGDAQCHQCLSELFDQAGARQHEGRKSLGEDLVRTHALTAEKSPCLQQDTHRSTARRHITTSLLVGTLLGYRSGAADRAGSVRGDGGDNQTKGIIRKRTVDDHQIIRKGQERFCLHS